MPAAAVIPAPQVEITIIGSKAFVAGFFKFLVKALRLNPEIARNTEKLETGKGKRYCLGSG